MKDLLRQVMSNPITYYPILGHIMGVEGAILFQQILYWQGVKKGKEFYKTDVEFAEETGILLKTLRTTKKELVSRGFVKVVLKGYPAKSYYTIDDECLEKVASVCPKSSSSLSQIVNKINETEQTEGGNTILDTETTTETTTLVDPIEKKETLPSLFGSSSLQRIVMIYSLLWFEVYGTKYRANFGAIGKNLKPLFDSLSEWQIAALIVIHFNWYGASGDDEYTFKRLESAMHPILWIPSHVNEYGTYLTNVLHVNFEDHEAVKKYVKEKLREAVRVGLQAGILKNDLPNNHGKD